MPMTSRIREALVQAGYPALDVTQEIEQVVGQAIPDQCRWDRTPVPPEPEPEPPQPGPGAMVCTGTVQAIPGAVQMTCTPQEETP
jgi:hypothetical protein